MTRVRTALLTATIVASSVSAAFGEEPTREKPPGADVATAIQMTAGDAAAPVAEKPVLTFGDPARDNEGGTVWVWTDRGRPVALMEMYVNSQSRSRVQVVTSLAEGPLDAEGGDGFAWHPTAAGTAFRPLDGPPPDQVAGVRLLQMKALARGFKGHEFWDPDRSRYELRLMPQPVFRYSAEREGVRDGAVFLLSHGTNPEIALVIEAARPAGGREAWRFAAARLGHAEMHLLRGTEEVWNADRVDVTAPDETYHLFYFNPPSENAPAETR